uniref:Uncharacterized protein n=1 Tax=Mesocestoides corti TaxID=53468 RepID=A0A5K3EW49_MESCO
MCIGSAGAQIITLRRKVSIKRQSIPVVTLWSNVVQLFVVGVTNCCGPQKVVMNHAGATELTLARLRLQMPAMKEKTAEDVDTTVYFRAQPLGRVSVVPLRGAPPTQSDCRLPLRRRAGRRARGVPPRTPGSSVKVNSDFHVDGQMEGGFF